MTEEATTTSAETPADAETEATGSLRGWFRDHAGDVEALRFVLLRVLLIAVAAVVIAFVFFKDELMHLVLYPLTGDSILLGRPPAVPDVKTLRLFDRFTALFWTSVVGALLLTAPYVLWEIWRFIRAGLKPSESRVFRRYFPLAVVLFLTGTQFAYWVMIPVAVDFLVGLGGDALPVSSDLLLSNYLDFFFNTSVALGIVFLIPLFLLAFVLATGIDPRRIGRYRRHAVVVALVVGMLLTPPDPMTQLILAGPMLILFEFGLLLAKIGYRRRWENAATTDAAEDEGEEEPPSTPAPKEPTPTPPPDERVPQSRPKPVITEAVHEPIAPASSSTGTSQKPASTAVPEDNPAEESHVPSAPEQPVPASLTADEDAWASLEPRVTALVDALVRARLEDRLTEEFVAPLREALAEVLARMQSLTEQPPDAREAAAAPEAEAETPSHDSDSHETPSDTPS